MVTLAHASLETARPWPRFWARMLDMALYSVPAGLLVALLFPGLITESATGADYNQLWLTMAALPLMLTIDAVILALAGTSPGKALAGLLLAYEDGGKLALGESLRRNTMIYFRGFVLGLPLIFLIGLVAARSDLADNGATSWDRDTASRVYSIEQAGWRTWLTAVVAIILSATMNALGRMA